MATRRKAPEDSEQAAVRRERERIAMDLHDGLMQSLYGLGISIGAVRLRYERQQQPLPEALRHHARLVDDMIEDLRAYIGQLQRRAAPAALAFGMEIERLLDEARASGGPRLEARLEPGFGAELPPEVEWNVASIAREALSNALRHSGASVVTVEAGTRRGRPELVVWDDGRGFHPSSVGRRAGDGMANMRWRAHAIGARLEISSRPGGGTRVRLRLAPTGPA